MGKSMCVEDEKRADVVFDPLLREFDFMLVGKIVTESARSGIRHVATAGALLCQLFAIWSATRRPCKRNS